MNVQKQKEKRKNSEIEKKLKSYRIYKTMLGLAQQEREAGEDDFRPNRAGERVLLTLRMREIERSLHALPMERERLLLELHYLEGHSVERCAEMLYISRATAYRLKRRGLEMLAAGENDRARHV